MFCDGGVARRVAIRMKRKRLQADWLKPEMMILTALLGAAAFSVSWIASQPRTSQQGFEPQLFYSDWLSDMAPLEAWVEVSDSQERMVAWLKRIFEREGVPGDLVWLAAVESGFNPAAVSARGAVGLFQLMPETGLRYGLRTGNPDERLDPFRNTQVAARYLADLYARFGDWSVVLAAYNAGENRIARLMRMREPNYDLIASRLPSETRSFVPRVRAVIEYQEQKPLEQVRAPYRRYGGLLLAADRIEP